MPGEAFTDCAGLDIQARYSTIDNAQHADALKLLAFWEARPADGIVMGRDIPSRAIASLLGHISILEPAEDRSDMCVRMAGTSLIKRWGRDVKGRMLSELFSPDELRDHLKCGFAAIDTDRPIIVDSALMAFDTVTRMHMEVVLLPIFATDRKSRWVLSGMFFFSLASYSPSNSAVER